MDTHWRAADRDTIGGAAGYLLTHPWRVFVLDWNWKAAVLSAIFRMAIWPVAMAGHGPLLAPGSVRGMCIEFGLRMLVGGFWGSLLQTFSAARPAWLAAVCAAILFPALTHCLEYFALCAGGSSHAGAAMGASVAFTMVSLLVNWSLMRRGILITGRGAASLGADFRRIFQAFAGGPAA